MDINDRVFLIHEIEVEEEKTRRKKNIGTLVSMLVLLVPLIATILVSQNLLNNQDNSVSAVTNQALHPNPTSSVTVSH